MPFHLLGRWDESHLTKIDNDASSDTKRLSVICSHHLWVTQDKEVSSYAQGCDYKWHFELRNFLQASSASLESPSINSIILQLINVFIPNPEMFELLE